MSDRNTPDPSARTSDRWRGVVVRTAVSAIAFAAVIAIAGPSSAFGVLRKASLLPVAVSIALLIARAPIMARRWQILLFSFGESVALGRLTRIQLVSTFVGLALPSSNGNDLVRGVLLRKSVGPAVGSIVTDRVLGLISMAFLALPGAGFLIASGHGAVSLVIIFAVSCAAVLATIMWPLLLPALLHSVHLVGRYTGEWGAQIADSIVGSSSMLTLENLASCIALSLISQLMTIASITCLGWSLHIPQPAALYFAFVPITWLATAIPVSIAGVGIREVSFAFLFQTVGAGYAQGVALGAMVSATGIVAALVGGLALFAKDTRPAQPT